MEAAYMELSVYSITFSAIILPLIAIILTCTQ